MKLVLDHVRGTGIQSGYGTLRRDEFAANFNGFPTARQRQEELVSLSNYMNNLLDIDDNMDKLKKFGHLT